MKQIRMSCDVEPESDYVVIEMDTDDTVIECWEDGCDVTAAVTIERSKAITIAKSILDYYGELDG